MKKFRVKHGMIRLNEKLRGFIYKGLKWFLLGSAVGFLSGSAATLFLVLLDKATQIRIAHPTLIIGLPIAGFFVGYLYYRHGKDVAGGNNLILEEIHNPKNTIPFRMAPLVLLGTVMTHLFGGSAGREGTAVQMGASLADQLSKYFKLQAQDRRDLLILGLGSGFGAAVGAPWAGTVFGIEVIRSGHFKLPIFAKSLIASFVAYQTTHLFHAPHTVYPRLEAVQLSIQNLVIVLVSGLIFGLTARLFSELTHQIEKLETRFISFPPFKPFIAGIILVLLFNLEGSYRYVGLGIKVIQESFSELLSWKDPLFKILFTSLTVASGFKGGEFIPLVFIGSTLGSVLSQYVPLPKGLLTSVGFSSVFAAASNTPIACSLMAIELLGWNVGPYVLIGCFVAYFVSGHRGIYKNQPKRSKKIKIF